MSTFTLYKCQRREFASWQRCRL